jgi:hypothetical protein
LLFGMAKQWFYANREKNTTSNTWSTTFLAMFFP